MATAPLSPPRPADRARPLRAGLIVLGVSQLALGLWMVIDPPSFFEYVGAFGAQNDHYIRDNATWNIALGVAALLAVPRPRWRVPVLALALVQFALHTINHIVDAGEAHASTSGWGDVASLAVGVVLLAGLLRWAADEG
jgi:hypothetical protein